MGSASAYSHVYFMVWVSVRAPVSAGVATGLRWYLESWSGMGQRSGSAYCQLYINGPVSVRVSVSARLGATLRWALGSA